jgi:hypothetical protein
MDSKLVTVRTFLSLLLVLHAVSGWSSPQNAGGQSSGTPSAALVQRALAAELKATQDTGHPMRYRLRKSSIRLTSTKEIVETKDGNVAILLSVDDKPLTPDDAQKDQNRLDALMADPERQRHRKQNEDDDTGRALKVLRALPKAFIYEYAGPGMAGSEPVEKFTFTPNTRFDPPDLETEVLTSLTGEIWIDAARERVVRLEGHLQQDVNFGWGILGRLNKGGWIVIEQGEVGGGLWRVQRFRMEMSGRVLFKTRKFDTSEEETDFAPVPAGLTYQQAIQMLRSGQDAPKPGGR